MIQTSIQWHSLASAANGFILEKDILIYYFELVCNNWNIILEDPLCKKIVPYCWRGNTLVLAVEDESYTNYIKMRESTLASQVRAVMGNDYCRNIAVKKVDFSKVSKITELNLN